jgi:hypothetical protein
MPEDVEDEKRVSRNIMVSVEIDRQMEELRKKNAGNITILTSRSDQWNYILSMGLWAHNLKEEYGHDDFERFVETVKKLNLKKVDLSKLI